MNKNIRAAIRFREAEYLHLQELAKQSGQSISDYIRSKLFEDESESEYDVQERNGKDVHEELKEVKWLQIMSSIFTKEIAKHILSDGIYEDNINEISNRLSELGYE